MRERINKPRAFLSHARKDVKFIERIETDLRRCQIDPWRDQYEIRDGEPWQKVIFAEGLPTCDVIITYYTENSLDSQMVAKEVDATLLRQLEDNGIGFLPYVSNDEIRGNLRLDIKALHCRVWNEENYAEVLPSVVAEIWRRYMERSIGIAVLQEKNLRLGAELELEKLKSGMTASIFTSQEESEFSYIFSKLNGVHKAICHFSYPKNQDKGAENICLVNYSLIRLLQRNVLKGDGLYTGGFLNLLEEETKEVEPFIQYLEQGYNFVYFHTEEELQGTLATLGLLTINLQPSQDSERMGNLVRLGYEDRTIFIFSEKMYKFVSWLEYNNKIESEPKIEFVEFAIKNKK